MFLQLNGLQSNGRSVMYEETSFTGHVKCMREYI